MTGTDTANIIPFSKLPTSVPGDYTALLTRQAADFTVMPGPGGSVTVQARTGDSIGATIAEAGLEFARAKKEVKTGDPKLDEPKMAGLGLWSMALATSLTSTLLTPPTLEEMLFGTEVLARKGEESAASSLRYIRQAKMAQAEEEGTTEGPQPESPQVLTLDPLSLWVGQMHAVADKGNKTLSSGQKVAASKMKSTSSSDVQEALVSLSELSESQLQPLLPHLSKLADTMSLANVLGGPLVLSSPIGLPITATLLTTVDAKNAPESLKAPLGNALYTIGNNIAKLNFEQYAYDRDHSAEYTQLTSQDPTQIATLLQYLVKDLPLPAGVTDAQIQSMLGDLAQELVDTGYASEFAQNPDMTTLTSKLKNKIDDLVAKGKIPAGVAPFVLTTMLPELASKLTAVIRAKLKTDLRSSNPATVGSALKNLTFTSSEPPPKKGEMYMYQNYMQALTAALVFMSQIRSTIISLEGSYEQELSKYQLQNVGIQSQIAVEQMQSKLKDISTKFQDTLSQIESQKWMRIFFPLIAIVVALVALIITVVSFVVTAVTAGAGSFSIGLATMADAQLIGFVVGIAVSAFSTVLTLADAIVQWASGGQTSMWGELAKAFGIKSKEGIAIFTVIANLIILIIVAILTLGIGLAVVAVKGITLVTKAGAELAEASAEAAAEAAAETSVEEGVEETAELTGFAAVKEVMKQMAKNGLKALQSTVGQQTVSCFIAAMFNGGAITTGIQKLLKLMHLDDKKTAILSMIITVLLMMVITMLASGRVPDFKSMKTSVQEFITSPLKTITEGLEAIESWVLDLGKTIFNSINKMAQRAADLKAGIKTFLEGLKIAPKVLEAAGKGAQEALQAAHSNAYWVMYNLAKQIKNAFQAILKMSVEGFKPAYEAELAESSWLVRIIAGMSGPLTHTLKLAQDGMQIATAAIQYQSARTQQQLQEQLSQLELESASLEALVDYFGNLQGVNPEALISAIADSTKSATEQWNDFVKLVDSFFVAAARSVSKATAESAI